MSAQALVREYLKHAGLHETIKALDVELVRPHESLTRLHCGPAPYLSGGTCTR